MITERPLRVLLVDDNRDGADTFQELLRFSGCEVEVVYSSAAALESAAENMPDVLISDIGMPNIDGCELARRVAAIDSITPLMIAVTGYSQVRDRCLLSGFDHFFLKPADPTAIVDVLRHHASHLSRLAGRFEKCLKAMPKPLHPGDS